MSSLPAPERDRAQLQPPAASPDDFRSRQPTQMSGWNQRLISWPTGSRGSAVVMQIDLIWPNRFNWASQRIKFIVLSSPGRLLAVR